MKTIKLSAKKNHGEATVDDEDFDMLSHYRWHLHTLGYAYRGQWNGKKRKTILMHRQVLEFPKGEIDHINHNKLDNRKKNLRFVSASINQHNRHVRKFGTYFDKSRNKYRTRIVEDGKVTYLGQFDDFQSGKKAYLSYCKNKGYVKIEALGIQ